MRPLTEHFLSIDNFNQPRTESGVHADATLVATLFMMKKGTNPLYPDMGFDVSSYRFQDIEDSMTQIKTEFTNHCSTYIPHIQIDTIDVQRTGKKVLLFGFTLINTYSETKTRIAFKVVEEKTYYTLENLVVL